jgi:poly-gamma-glutamate capsule biosynthesis protein CapA/YwtB (metallophosphatase superfamily)
MATLAQEVEYLEVVVIPEAEAVSVVSEEEAAVAVEPVAAGKIISLVMKIQYQLLGVLILFVCNNDVFAQKLVKPIPTPDTSRVTLLFAGDVMGHMPQVNSAYDSSSGKYNFNPVYDFVRPVISKADIAIANLETTLAGNPFSGYPQFSSPDSLASALKNAGFDLLITANNHCLDRGPDGLTRTIQVLDSFKIQHTGTFENDSTRKLLYPYIYSVNGIKIAFLNYTYGTNGITAQPPVIVNYIDSTQIIQDILTAKEKRVDYIIVTLHWGIEYERTENSNQKNIAKYLLKNGADLIIGSHPHVVQPIQKVYPQALDSTNFNLIVYSLGNYITNQRDRYKDGGIMFQVNLQKIRNTKIANYSYIPVWVYKGTIHNKISYRLIPMYNSEIDQDFLNATDKENAKQFFEDTFDLLRQNPISQN